MIYLLIVLLILAVVAYFFFKKPKADEKLSAELRAHYDKILKENVLYYQKLLPKEQRRFVDRVAVFLEDTHIEAVDFEIDDRDKLLIAASAIIPVFGFQNWRYTQLTNVLLYPDSFDNDFKVKNGKRELDGLVGGGFLNGQMILSRLALYKGFSSATMEQNTGIHEFAHLIDGQDGATDGVPDHLLNFSFAKPWAKMIHQEIRRINEGKSDINPYGATNEAEFFAVVAEYFFQKPDQLKIKHPELYESLSKIFMQNPAGNSY